MVLGDRGGPSWRRVGRCSCVWACGTTAIAIPAWLLARAVSPAWTRPATLAALPFDQALPQLAALALLGCAAWAWLALTMTVVEASLSPADPWTTPKPWHLPGHLPGHLPARLPGPLRRAVLTACGVALVAGLTQPAHASPRLAPTTVAHDRGGAAATGRLGGLPLPAVPAAHASRPRRGRSAAPAVVVVPGDTLWSIAQRDLPSGATASAVDLRWRQIYDANRALIGPDPDVLRPGQRLLMPPHDLPTPGERPRHDSRPNS